MYSCRGLGMALAMIGIVSMGVAVAVIIGVALLCVVGDLIVGVKYGQSGSRVFRMGGVGHAAF